MLKTIRSNSNQLFFLILFLALLLRLVGIQHSFPYILHPDEPAVVRSALAVRFDPNPHHFDWPHLFIYLNYFAFKGFAWARELLVQGGLREAVSSVFPIMWDDYIVFYFISRVFAAILGALTVIPVYLTGKNLFGDRAGLYGALAMALIPFHVRNSHYALIDVPMTFLLSWSLYFCSKILSSKETANYIWAGFFAGLAASTKYNGVFVLLVIPLAYLFRVIAQKGERFFDARGFLRLAFSGFFSILGFLVGTPFALLDYTTFTRTDGPVGALWQFTNVGKVELASHLWTFFTLPVSSKIVHFGYVLLLAYIMAILYYTYRLFRRKFEYDELNIWLLLIPSLFFFWYVTGVYRNRAQYYMITYPFVAIVVGYFLYLVLAKVKYFKKALFMLFFLIPLYFCILNIVDLTKPPIIETDTKIYGGRYERW